MLEFTKAVWNSYGLDAHTHHVLLYICDRIHAETNRERFDKAEFGIVKLSYEAIMFRCAISKPTLVSRIAKLREIGIIKTRKAGARQVFYFIVFYNPIKHLARTMDQERNMKGFKDKFYKGPVTEEELADYYGQEYVDDGAGTSTMTDPMEGEGLEEVDFGDEVKELNHMEKQSANRAPKADAVKRLNPIGKSLNLSGKAPLPNAVKPLNRENGKKSSASTGTDGVKWNQLLHPGVEVFRGGTSLSGEPRLASPANQVRTDCVGERASASQKRPKPNPQTSGTPSPNPNQEHTCPEPVGEINVDHPSLRSDPPVPSPPSKPKCLRCDKEWDRDPNVGGRICGSCRKNMDDELRTGKERVEKGLCPQCGVNPRDKVLNWCPSCYYKKYPAGSELVDDLEELGAF